MIDPDRERRYRRASNRSREADSVDLDASVEAMMTIWNSDKASYGHE